MITIKVKRPMEADCCCGLAEESLSARSDGRWRGGRGVGQRREEEENNTENKKRKEEKEWMKKRK